MGRAGGRGQVPRGCRPPASPGRAQRGRAQRGREGGSGSVTQTLVSSGTTFRDRTGDRPSVAQVQAAVGMRRHLPLPGCNP